MRVLKFKIISLSIIILLTAVSSKAQTFYGCRHKENGDLRLASAQGQCHKTEEEVTWASSGDQTELINALSAEVDVLKNALGILNNPPTANAGPNRTIAAWNSSDDPPQIVFLDGTATDDGLIAPLTFQWQKKSFIPWTNLPGEGEPIFSNPNEVDTWVGFDWPGTYQLELVVSDGGAIVSPWTRITVFPANSPAIVNAGATGYIQSEVINASLGIFKCTAQITGSSVEDDGLPEPLTIEWVATKVTPPTGCEGEYSLDSFYTRIDYSDKNDLDPLITIQKNYISRPACRDEAWRGPWDFEFALTAFDGQHNSASRVTVRCPPNP